MPPADAEPAARPAADADIRAAIIALAAFDTDAALFFAGGPADIATLRAGLTLAAGRGGDVIYGFVLRAAAGSQQ